MHRKVAAAFVAALVLGAAGCGGAEPLTRAQLVRRIETACADGKRTSQRQLRSARGSSGDAQRRFIAAIVAGQHVIVDGIEDLEPPDGSKSSFEAFKQALTERTDLFDRLQSGSAAEVRRAISEVQPETERLTRRLTEAARRLSVEGCV